MSFRNNCHSIVQHSYHDHSTDYLEHGGDSGDSSHGGAAFVPFANTAAKTGSRNNKLHGGGGVSVPFPTKLYELLQHVDLIEAGLSDIISWQPHGRCFLVHRIKEFESNVLSRFFKQHKYASFQRQLNLYGFNRITRGPDRGGYYHELFLRGRKVLCYGIRRIKIKGTGKRMKANPDAEPNFYAMTPMGPSSSKESAMVNYMAQEVNKEAEPNFYAMPQLNSSLENVTRQSAEFCGSNATAAAVPPVHCSQEAIPVQSTLHYTKDHDHDHLHHMDHYNHMQGDQEQAKISGNNTIAEAIPMQEAQADLVFSGRHTTWSAYEDRQNRYHQDQQQHYQHQHHQPQQEETTTSAPYTIEPLPCQQPSEDDQDENVDFVFGEMPFHSVDSSEGRRHSLTSNCSRRLSFLSVKKLFENMASSYSHNNHGNTTAIANTTTSSDHHYHHSNRNHHADNNMKEGIKRPTLSVVEKRGRRRSSLRDSFTMMSTSFRDSLSKLLADA